MLKQLLLCSALASAVLLTGCASVPMADASRDSEAKSFSAPADQANIYLYRNENMGAGVKMDVSLDGRQVGQTVAKSYLLMTVPAGTHSLKGSAENDSELQLTTEAGKNYFVRQYIKLGVFVGGADLEVIPETQGKEAVAKLALATPGNCSSH